MCDTGILLCRGDEAPGSSHIEAENGNVAVLDWGVATQETSTRQSIVLFEQSETVDNSPHIAANVLS